MYATTSRISEISIIPQASRRISHELQTRKVASNVIDHTTCWSNAVDNSVPLIYDILGIVNNFNIRFVKLSELYV